MGLRIALVKPDWGVSGGAEVVVDQLERFLGEDGHRVERRTISIPALPRQAFGVRLPDAIWAAASEYFRYLSTRDAVDRVDVSGADLVISTQPPSWAVRHPRHLCVFFHHLRVFYDLERLYVDAGLAGPPEIHAAARDRVRALDQADLEEIGWFCTNSEVTAARLATYNGLANASVHHAGIGVGMGDEERLAGAETTQGTGDVLCVSRSEFSKRTELFVHAMKYCPGRRGALVGTGGRLPWVQAVDARLSSPRIDLDSFGPADLWLNRGEWAGSAKRARGSNVEFAGWVSDADLLRRYREAPCVVAPAYDEDYGLTALEAMAHCRPVVVCEDGGGLTAFVEDGVNGFVVAPTGRAIADAVERICADPGLARRLGEGARATAAAYTWERCGGELREAVERVMSDDRMTG